MSHPNRTTKRTGENIPLQYVRAVFEGGEPMITSEIEELFEIRHRTAVDKLEQLHERGELERKQIGTQVAIWWRSTDGEPESVSCVEVEVVTDESGASPPG